MKLPFYGQMFVRIPFPQSFYAQKNPSAYVEDRIALFKFNLLRNGERNGRKRLSP